MSMLTHMPKIWSGVSAILLIGQCSAVLPDSNVLVSPLARSSQGLQIEGQHTANSVGSVGEYASSYRIADIPRIVLMGDAKMEPYRIHFTKTLLDKSTYPLSFERDSRSQSQDHIILKIGEKEQALAALAGTEDHSESRPDDNPWKTITSITLTEKGVDDQEECPICLQPFADTVIVDKCGHKFCRGCLATHVRTGTNQNPSCPMCRGEISERKPRRVLPRDVSMILVSTPSPTRVSNYWPVNRSESETRRMRSSIGSRRQIEMNRQAQIIPDMAAKIREFPILISLFVFLVKLKVGLEPWGPSHRNDAAIRALNFVKEMQQHEAPNVLAGSFVICFTESNLRDVLRTAMHRPMNWKPRRRTLGSSSTRCIANSMKEDRR